MMKTVKRQIRKLRARIFLHRGNLTWLLLMYWLEVERELYFRVRELAFFLKYNFKKGKLIVKLYFNFPTIVQIPWDDYPNVINVPTSVPWCANTIH
jgi:hypothetical protein